MFSSVDFCIEFLSLHWCSWYGSTSVTWLLLQTKRWQPPLQFSFRTKEKGLYFQVIVFLYKRKAVNVTLSGTFFMWRVRKSYFWRHFYYLPAFLSWWIFTKNTKFWDWRNSLEGIILRYESLNKTIYFTTGFFVHSLVVICSKTSDFISMGYLHFSLNKTTLHDEKGPQT